MGEDVVRVFIMCRNGLLRESLARVLSKKSDIRVVGAQSSESIASSDFAQLGVDVVVLDSLHRLIDQGACFYSSGHESGSAKCLVIAMEEDPKQFLAAVQQGAAGFVPQEASTMEVITAIRAVARGQAVCPPKMVKLLFDFVVSRAPGRPNSQSKGELGLTNREQQLIPLLGRGLTNKEIAAELQLSEQTVKNHVHRILRKVGAEDRIGVFEAYQMRSLGL